MKFNEEHLGALLEFLDDILVHPENNWFKEELLKILTWEGIAPDGRNVYFTGFIKNLRANYIDKSKYFYRNVKNKKLRSELERDFQEMLWWKMMNNVKRQYSFAFYQMENMLNYFISNSNALEKVIKDPKRFTLKFNEKFIVRCGDDIKTNDITKVKSIYTKIVIWAYEKDKVDWLLTFPNKYNIDNIVNIRNLNSHQNSQKDSPYYDNLVKEFKHGDETNHGYVINILNEFKETVVLK